MVHVSTDERRCIHGEHRIPVHIHRGSGDEGADFQHLHPLSFLCAFTTWTEFHAGGEPIVDISYELDRETVTSVKSDLLSGSYISNQNAEIPSITLTIIVIYLNCEAVITRCGWSSRDYSGISIEV